jgi:drug/metabolite transporter (DMT)-like permease
MMDEAGARGTGRLVAAVGVVAAGSAVSLATFFAVGGPFGTINDIGNAAVGVLSAALAWRLRQELAGPLRDVAVGLALVGATLTVIGSALVVSGTTGFFLAGLVSSVGFAGIGTWLVIANRARVAGIRPAGRLRYLGLLAGSLMAAGVVSAPGILLQFDDMATAPGWVWIGFLGWLGTFVAYPAWALAVAWTATRVRREAMPPAVPAA